MVCLHKIPVYSGFSLNRFHYMFLSIICRMFKDMVFFIINVKVRCYIEHRKNNNFLNLAN